MSDLPSGTVTFLFTDIEGSTALWEHDPVAMRVAVDRHFTLLRDVVAAHHGVLFKTVGDAVHAAFASASAAVASAVAAQQALHAESWALPEPLRVRMALHTGEATPTDGDYAAPVLNRLARLLAVGHGGQVLLSGATHQLVRTALPAGTELRDIGEHRLRDLQPERIFQLVAPDMPSDFPTLRSLDTSPTNLPSSLTSFIGREREVASVQDLLRDETVRLVTLTGPGGVGKTRLAVQAAAGLAESSFLDGLVFVNLAPLSDPGLVASTIASVLGVREEGPLPLQERLVAALRNRHLLLILDNFEHLLAAAPLVSALLGEVPALTVLATSRIRLRLQGEREVAVSPLPTPALDLTSPTPESVAGYAAVRLFVDRAREARPDFTLTADNAAVVAAICTRLDGLPLALALAAARVKLLPPRALLARLEQRLPLLTGGPRDLPARQQTLRATIAWSYDLLTAAEQTLFRRLGVFPGSWTIEAAEAIAKSDGEARIDTLEGLGALVDESLVQLVEETDEEPRFRMLETIREYGSERLEESDEEQAVRRVHARYFVTLAETAYSAPSLETEWWLPRLQLDLDNFRAALTWLLAHEPAEAVRLAGALGVVWDRANLFAEGRQWLTHALAAAPAAPRNLRARALVAAGWLTHQLGDFPQAELDLTDAVVQVRRLDDIRLRCVALFYLCGAMLSQGEAERAQPISDELLTLARTTDDLFVIIVATFQAGHVALAKGELPRAEAHLAEALDLAQRSNWSRGAAVASGWLGKAVLARGDHPRAAALLREAVLGFAAANDWAVVAEYLETLAGATVASQPTATVRFLGAASQIRTRLGHPRKPAEGPAYDQTLAIARATLGDAAFTAAWTAGQLLSQDEALAAAVAVATATATTPAAEAQPQPA